jgi:hypothetical protein
MKVIHFTIALITCFLLLSFSKDSGSTPSNVQQDSGIEPYDFSTFTFTSNGVEVEGKIYLPEAYMTNDSLPVVFLIDYTSQHFITVKDEFDYVIKGVEEIENTDALVVTLKEQMDIDANPDGFQEYYDVFLDMTFYVDSVYTSNTNRTFVGRGSEAGIVLMAMHQESADSSVFDNFIATDSPETFNDVLKMMFQNDNFPNNMPPKKLHFSFSVSNDSEDCTELINVIESQEYSWLTFESKEYTSSYESAYKSSFAEGLAFIFQ